jgi:hypothetical protein
MVATLLGEDQPEFFININELHPLEEMDFEDAAEIREARPLDDFTVETLVFSNPRTWPPILVTKTDIGYVVIDGRHRWQAAKERPLEQLKATCKTFKTPDEVIEAAYTANFTHGKPASKETRSSYARWLHKKDPELTQKEIGKRAGIKQATVSEALSRPAAPPTEPKQPAKPARGKPKELVPGQFLPSEEEQRHARRRKEARTMIRDMTKFFDDIKDLDEEAQRAEIAALFASTEDRNHFLAVAHLVESVLEPPKPTPRKRQS